MSCAARVALVGALVLARTADAQGRFQVEPTRVDLSSTAPSGAITVTNHGVSVLRVEASAFRWSESIDGAMQLADAPEIVVRPSLFEIAPGRSRTFRVGTTAMAGAVEQSFRVFVAELPDRTAQPGVRVLTRIGVPVFIAPRLARLAIDVRPAIDGDKHVVLVHNPGTLHVKLASVKLRAAEGGWERGAAGWYVLPGETRRFVVPPGNPCGEGARWVAEAIAEDGARWVSPASGCGR